MQRSLTDQELDVIDSAFKLAPGLKLDYESLKLAMVKLAHDGSDRAIAILSAARVLMPPTLRGFFECAWDECTYLNFIGKVNDVRIDLESLPALIATSEGSDEELAEKCQAIEDDLATRGVLVDLRLGVPIQLRLAYVRRLVESLGELRYHGSGFVHFDGCTNECIDCIQRQWCDSENQ